MCLVRYRPPLDRVRASLRFDDVAALVDGNPALERLTVQGLGEPLLAPDLVPIVAHAAARGVHVEFNTNGMLLDERHGRALIEAGLGRLCVSLDGATAATYEAIRDGARFERVVENLRRFVELKRALGAAHPDLWVVFVAMRRNVDELPDLVRLVADVGAPALRVQHLSHSFDDCDPSGSYAGIRAFAAQEALVGGGDEARVAAVYERATALAGELGVDLRLPSLEPSTPGCRWPWDGAYITHDGTVQPCCMVMGSDRVSLGNVRDAGFEEVWHGDAYERFRTALLSDDPPDVCRGCSVYNGTF